MKVLLLGLSLLAAPAPTAEVAVGIELVGDREDYLPPCFSDRVNPCPSSGVYEPDPRSRIPATGVDRPQPRPRPDPGATDWRRLAPAGRY
jgi:hypothetical protein